MSSPGHMTPARALVHRAGFVAWHDGILDVAAGLFAYHEFVACHRVPVRSRDHIYPGLDVIFAVFARPARECSP